MYVFVYSTRAVFKDHNCIIPSVDELQMTQRESHLVGNTPETNTHWLLCPTIMSHWHAAGSYREARVLSGVLQGNLSAVEPLLTLDHKLSAVHVYVCVCVCVHMYIN